MAISALPFLRSATGGRARAWQEFGRVFNPALIALVFYFCLLQVTTRWLPYAYADPGSDWPIMALRSLRQTLISGLTILLAIALVRAAIAGRSVSRPRSLALGFGAVLAAAALAGVIRLLVFGVPIADIPSRWAWMLGTTFLWTLIGSLAYALIHFAREELDARQALVDQTCARDALTAQMTQARLSALQAQIEPHFLFNTLANVKRLYETAPTRGREMLSSLIDYLRAALPSMRQTGSTLRREFDLARSYLTILQMRMGERLAFSIEAPADLMETEVPPLVLGTLLENAIKHGLGPLPAGGRIDIRAWRQGASMVLEVRDTGAGFAGSGGCGVGLANTRSRLSALYGERASLQLQLNAPQGVVATVVLPITGAAAAVPLEVCA